MKEVIRILLLGLMISLMACSDKSINLQGKSYFRYNQIGGLESLDPAFAKNLAIMWTSQLLYNTLVTIDERLSVSPSLARRYEISNDGLTYTFYLRDNIYFHDHEAFEQGVGRKMTARDVAYSFYRIIDPKTASPGAWVFNDRVAPELPFVAIDDTTLEIRLIKPFAPFIQILSMPYCSVVPQEVVEYYGTDFRSHPCGTGPFAFTSWDEGNVLLFKRNNRYWEQDNQGKSLPYLDGVKVTFHETRAMEFLMLKEGSLDFVNGIDGSMKDLILNKNGTLKRDLESDITLTKRPYLNTEYIGILMTGNQSVNPLLNRALRKAINIGIDREKIITYFRNGVGIAAVRGFTPDLMPGMDLRPNHYQYNPEEASKIVETIKKRNPKGIPSIKIHTPEGNADVCNLIASQLADIGLKVQVEVVQPSILRQMMSQGQTPYFKAQWIADYPDAETYLAFFYGPMPAPPNYTRYNNPRYDNLYQQAMAIADDSLRQYQYRVMDSMISQEMPIVPLFYDEMLHFTRKSVEGFTANPMNIIDVKRVRIRRK